MTTLQRIDTNVKTLREQLIDPEPSHYSTKDLAGAFFGAVVIGLTFVHKGGLINYAQTLTIFHVLAISISTLLITGVATYYLGYRRVKHKNNREPFQFFMKRMSTFYGVGVVVSVWLALLFNLSLYAQGVAFYNLIVMLAMPCCVGACLGDLVNKY